MVGDARDREIAAGQSEADAQRQRFDAARAFESDWRGRLADGGATLAELDDAVLKGVLADGQAESLRGEAERAVERRKYESDLVERIHGAITAGKRLDSADQDDRAAVDHVFKTVYRPRLIEAVADPKAFIQLLPDLTRDIERIGMAPEAIDDLVGRWWTSGDLRFQAGAAPIYGALGRFEETNGTERAAPLGLAPPNDLRQHLDLAASLIDAGISDDLAVKKGGGDGVH